MDRSIHLFSPATVANVACGFDIFGFALEQPGDELEITLNERPGVRILAVTGDGGILPLSPEKNVAGVAANAFLEKIEEKKWGVDITLHKKMPLGSGLGSSAASAAGAVYGLNLLLDSPLKVEELIPLAMEGERVACGSAHADNVAPALLGGFVIIRSYNPLDVISIPLALELFCAVFHPAIELLTRDSRASLPSDIPLKLMVQQSGNAAALIAALLLGDLHLLGRSLDDVVVEPYRASLVPGFAACKAAAIEAGAIGCSLSGSGPAIFALAGSNDEAQKVGKAMEQAMNDAGVLGTLYVSGINQKGPRQLG